MLYSPSSHASIFSPMLLHFLSHAPPFSLLCSFIFSPMHLHFLFKGIFFLFNESSSLSL